MTFKRQTFKDWKIDSLKMSIDLKFVNPQIQENLVIYDLETSEILDDFKSKSRKINYYGFDFYISKVTKILPNGKRIDKFYILLSSKLQGKNYFEGVNTSLIVKVLQYLKSLKIIDYKYKDLAEILRNFHVQDIDFCIDFIYKPKAYESLKDRFSQYAKDYLTSNKLNTGIKPFTNKGQLGLQVNHRETATVGRPFFKLYNKGVELQLQKNRDIFNLLSDYNQRILKKFLIIRYELTMRNKSYFDKFKTKNTLKYWLGLSQESMNINCYEMKSEFYFSNFRKKSYDFKIKTFKPMEIVLIKLMYHIRNNTTKQNADTVNMVLESYFTDGFTSTQKTRQKQLLNKLLSVLDYHVFTYEIIKSDNTTNPTEVRRNKLKSERILKNLLKNGLDIKEMQQTEKKNRDFLDLLAF